LPRLLWGSCWGRCCATRIIFSHKDYLQWISLGEASDFTPGETRLVSYTNPFANSWDGETARVHAYVRCTEPGKFKVFAINCAHLGFPVRWFSESQLFMCPCRGGVYYADGSRASGPSERGLFTYEAKIHGGNLLINAGQMLTLNNRANRGSCLGAATQTEPSLISRIEPCPPTNTPGTNASAIGRTARTIRRPRERRRAASGPKSTASWWYVFGSDSITLLILQVVTPSSTAAARRRTDNSA
jgi:hypothetical protein